MKCWMWHVILSAGWDIRAAFDTLEYLQRGGRIGKAQAFLGSLLKVNPIIGLKDGEVSLCSGTLPS